MPSHVIEIPMNWLWKIHTSLLEPCLPKTCPAALTKVMPKEHVLKLNSSLQNIPTILKSAW